MLKKPFHALYVILLFLNTLLKYMCTLHKQALSAAQPKTQHCVLKPESKPLTQSVFTFNMVLSFALYIYNKIYKCKIYNVYLHI